MMLTKEEIQEDLIRNSKAFHFGTLSSTHEGVREATRYAIDVAKEAGCLISLIQILDRRFGTHWRMQEKKSNMDFQKQIFEDFGQ